MIQRRDFITLGGAIAGALVLPIKLPRQWFVTSISGYVIRLKKGQGMYQWLDEIKNSYPNLKEVTLNLFTHGSDPIPALYANCPVWKMGDGV